MFIERITLECSFPHDWYAAVYDGDYHRAKFKLGLGLPIAPAITTIPPGDIWLPSESKRTAPGPVPNSAVANVHALIMKRACGQNDEERGVTQRVRTLLAVWLDAAVLSSIEHPQAYSVAPGPADPSTVITPGSRTGLNTAHVLVQYGVSANLHRASVVAEQLTGESTPELRLAQARVMLKGTPFEDPSLAPPDFAVLARAIRGNICDFRMGSMLPDLLAARAIGVAGIDPPVYPITRNVAREATATRGFLDPNLFATTNEHEFLRWVYWDVVQTPNLYFAHSYAEDTSRVEVAGVADAASIVDILSSRPPTPVSWVGFPPDHPRLQQFNAERKDAWDTYRKGK